MVGGVEFGAVAFGIAASLVWGTSDFAGGVVTKRLHLAAVMAISYTGGLVLLVVLATAWQEPLPTAADVWWASLAGIAGAVGLSAQYHALSVGRMGIAAPVAAVLGTAWPVVFAGITEGAPGSLQIAGFALALVSVALIAQSPARGDGPSGLGIALIAGTGFGAFFVLLDRVSQDAVFWPLVAARTAALSIAVIWVLQIQRAQRTQWQPARTLLLFVVLTGLLDVSGNLFFLLAAQAGRLDVASVLSSFYPAITVILARVVLREDITRPQTAGIIAAVIALPLVAG